jgi:hypothetical protein
LVPQSLLTASTATRRSPREFDRVFAAAATEIDDRFVAAQFEAFKNREERLFPVTPEAVVKFGIPIGHGVRLDTRPNCYKDLW